MSTSTPPSSPARTPVAHAVRERGIWFGPDRRRRFGWLASPAAGTASLGVVLCPPMGEEARSAQRTFRTLGTALAARGLCALRLDYDGTGDSVGAQDDPDRVAAWQQSIRDAVAELRSLGATRIALVGMRLGATLAATVSAVSDVHSLVLWDPCTSGRTFLREGQLLHAMGEASVAATTDGSVETPGFRYDPVTAAAVLRLKLASVPGPLAERVLVLTRDGELPRGAALAGSEVGTAHGQPELIGVEPNFAQVPTASLAEVVDWTAAAATTPFEVGVPAANSAVIATDAGPIRERIVTLGPTGLFGIVTEPVESTDAPWIVLVNVATELHIGPGRRWVEFARDWAAQGFRCVRMDQSGLGNSPLRPGQSEDVVFDGRWLDDLPEVVDELGEDGSTVSVFALCSGAYSAFEAAMRSKVEAIYAVNARVSLPEMARGERVHDRRRLVARPHVRPVAVLARRNSYLAWGIWRAYRQLAFWHAPMGALLPVLRRGTTVRLVANGKDAQGFREVLLWRLFRGRAVRRSRRYELAVRDEVDHPMMTQQAQQIVHADATAWFAARYGIRRVAVRNPKDSEVSTEVAT